MIFDLLDYILGEIKMLIYKLAYGAKLRYSVFSKYSNGIQIRLCQKGRLNIGQNVTLRDGVRIRVNFNGKVSLGSGVGLNNYSLINAMEEITIGDNTIIGQGVKIYDHDHDYKKKGKIRTTGFQVSPVQIGNNVWIGSNVTILRGTQIGDNCVIGANTLVKGEIAANSLVFSKPNQEIRVIKKC